LFWVLLINKNCK